MKITDYLYPSKGEKLLPDYSNDEMEEVTVTIQNEVLKKKKLDHRTVDALFIKLTKKPGVQIFILEPTRNDLRNCHFTLDESTKLTISCNGWVYKSFKIILTPKPSHPIIYARLIGYDVPYAPVTISFNLVRYKDREHSVNLNPNYKFQLRPHFDEDAYLLFDESDYMIGEIWDPTGDYLHLPVHMKNMDGYRRVISTSYSCGNIYREEPDTSDFSEVTKIGILETYDYFNRNNYIPEVGYHFFDGAYEYEVLDIDYLDLPKYPILVIGRLDHKLIDD